MAKKGKKDAINEDFSGKDILSIDQFDKASLEIIFKTTKHLIEKKDTSAVRHLLYGKLITLLFFEPSTRTFSSFSAAAKRLGAQTIEYQNPSQTSSTVKGETIEDTARVFENYSDAIIMRHPEIGAPHKGASVVGIPVINAGDGAGEHPTQAILDLYTIYEKFGKIDGISGLICADALYGRGVHSLLKAFGVFKNVTIYLLAPKELKLSKELFKEYTKKGVNLIEIHSEKDIPNDCDFWYWTRLQKERYVTKKRKIHMFRLTSELIKEKAKKNMIIMHILPRIDEVDIETDSDPRVIYLSKQVKNGMYTRMALLSLILGKT